MLDKAIRDLDRERMGLQNQEKKLVLEIKKAAKQGQMVRRACACHARPCAIAGLSMQGQKAKWWFKTCRM